MRARAQDSHGPHTSRERTWDSVAAAAGFLDRFSLSPNLIFAVMGALDKAGYRSAELYTEVTKQKYISNGGQWTSQLALAAKNPQESMPKRQPLPLPEVAALCDKSHLLASGGPEFAIRSTLLASWWLLREIEASNAKLEHIQTDHHEIVKWRPPQAKPTGKHCERRERTRAPARRK